MDLAPVTAYDRDVSEDGSRATNVLTASQRTVLLRRTPFRTGMKVLFGLTSISGLLLLMWHRGDLAIGQGGQLALCLFCVILLGLLYAHVAEYQHELLHGHGFRSDAVNRFLGFLCGLPMLNSYSHYRYQHLKHHRYLGTPRNTEHFQYPYEGLDSPRRLLAAAFNLGRYRALLATMLKAMLGKGIADIEDEAIRAQVRTEHALYLGVVLAVVVYSLWSRDAFFLIAWIVPSLLIAEPMHFFIELPEHFGLEAYEDRDVFRNTRTVEAPWLLRWYTNGNNLHTAHHLMAGVPMSRCHDLHLIIRDRYHHYERSYSAFFSSVLSGKLRPIHHNPHRN